MALAGTWARFRFSSATNLNFVGEAPDGEVEDYQVDIAAGVPAIVLTSPTDGSSYVAPATVNLSASVATNGNVINAVEFYSNATNLLTEITAAPFSYAWTNVGAGSYSLLARLIYGGSNSVDSASIGLSVTNPPVPPPSPIFTQFSIGVDGSVLLSGTGAPGQAYVLLTTFDLTLPIDWAPAVTNSADTNGVFSFSDVPVTNFPQRFYRLSTP